MLKKLKLPNGVSRWGAQMGRSDILPDDCNAEIKLQLQLVPMTDYGNYDKWGAYWGSGGGQLYCAWKDDVKIFVRADSRDEAKKSIRELLLKAKFYR